MNRRNFLLQTTTLAAGAAVLQPSCGLLPKSKPDPKGPAIGLQLYTVRDEISKGLDPLIEKIGSLGYTHLETFGFSDGKFFGKSPKELRNLIYDNGILIPSGHYYNDTYLTDNGDSWKLACEAANILEHEYIVLPWLDKKFIPSNAEGYTQLAKRITKLATIARDAGLKFAYHNHDFELKYNWEAKTSLYQVLLEQTDPELVKMEMDLFWVVYADGDPVTLFYQHPKRFPLFHVKDLDPLSKQNSDLGKGSVDFPAIFKHKAEAGLKYFFVEQENYAVSPLDSIEKNIAYVKKALV